MTRRISVLWIAVVVLLAGGIAIAVEGVDGPYPKLVTAETRADADRLSVLERPGDVFFHDEFESTESLKKYFEVRGLREGRAKLTTNAELAHKGSGAIQFTAVARDGRESGAGATAWFGPKGHDRV